MNCKPMYEFLMWDNCNNNCKFCFQRESPRLLSNDMKKDSCLKVKQFLESDRFKKGSHILLVGGELFDHTDRLEMFEDLFQFIADKMKKNEIELFYLNTNLLFDQLCLDNMIKLMEMLKSAGISNRIKFTSSFDYDGRFDKQEKIDLWKHNILQLHDRCPEVPLAVNTILTKTTCNMINSGELSVKKFSEDFNCYVNLVPYIIYDENLSAPKAHIFSSLLKVNKEFDGKYIRKYIDNFDLPQDKILFYYNKLKKDYVYCSSELADCGHSVNFKRYSTENTCFVCDLKNVFDNYMMV